MTDRTDRTRLIAAATRRGRGRRPVAPPIERASTLLNDTPGAMRDEGAGPVYGIEDLSAARELRTLLSELEGAADAWLVPSGLAAVTVPLTALLRPGDEVLTTDALYGPSRRFLGRHLGPRGITTTFHDAGATTGQVIAALTDRTRLLLIESPSSLTFEMFDVPALAAACRARGVRTVMDNTWGAGLAFRPLAHGVDVSVQAVTKYVAGHSDLLMGSIAVADPAVGRPISETLEDLGWRVSPDDAWLALRGLRTLPLRYAEQARAARIVARPRSVEARLYGRRLDLRPRHARRGRGRRPRPDVGAGVVRPRLFLGRLREPDHPRDRPTRFPPLPVRPGGRTSPPPYRP